MDKKSNKEFVPECFIWLGLEEQKRRANEINEMTKSKNEKK